MRGALPKNRSLRIATLSALVLGFVIVSTGIIAALFPATAAASTSSLEVLDGVVALSRDGQNFTQGQDGDLVEQGDVVRTGEDSHAVLTFFDGSTIEVEPESELIVQTLKATSAGDIVMELQQNLGRSWHVVSRALTPNSKYEVRTPTTTASVRGTAFLIGVDPTGKTNVQTTDGLVRATGGGVMVEVPPGFQTDVEPGGAPDAPTPAPPPPALIKIILDPTPNAAVTDSNGRTVGVINGLPVRYVPGSTVTMVDGKLVITIPNPTLGRIDTHVQPADPNDTSVDVEVIVQVGDAVVGNVVEQRTIGTGGVAKGGVLLTTNGTFVLPDDEANKAADPRIGRLPPPPPSGFGLPFIVKATPGPTPIVTPAPSFVPRFDFDPRLVALATATPPPPAPTPRPTFAGGFQPYTDTTTLSSATPAPNSGLQVFSGSDATLTKLIAPSPTPTPTLSTKLVAPILLLTPTPSPTPSLALRTISPILLITVAPSPTPTGTVLILQTITPIFLITPSPTPAPTTLILRTLDPIFILPTASPSPTPTFILATINPILFFTPTPTPAPTLILRTVSPTFFILPTASPTPAPTLLIIPTFVLPTFNPTPTPTPTAPLIFQTIAPLPSLSIAPSPTPSPTPILKTIAPLPTFFIATPTPTPTLAPLPTLSCRLFGCP
jgi:hypothetical protein